MRDRSIDRRQTRAALLGDRICTPGGRGFRGLDISGLKIGNKVWSIAEALPSSMGVPLGHNVSWRSPLHNHVLGAAAA